MNKTKIAIIILLLFTINNVMGENYRPRVAIIISKTSVAQHWGVSQMAAHGWGGIVNLAGIPYDCLFVEELQSGKFLDRYDCLIFGQCGYVANSDYDNFVKVLDSYLGKNGNVILDGQLAWFDENGRERNHSKLDSLLNIQNDGFKGDANYRIKVSDNVHFITRPFKSDEYITQNIANGLNIQQFKNSGAVLLELTDEKKSFPFLSVKSSTKNRIILVNDFSTWSSVSSIFRNNQPQGFYENQMYNVLIQALYWSVYGSIETPIPSLQVSNANLTAIIRLDADASQNLDAQIQTINYLNQVALESGVVPVYAWVSSFATKAGWQDLAPLGKKLENFGGQIGTHSRFHRIDSNMNDERWIEELDGAISEIEYNMFDYGYDIGKVDCFVNPGNTIYMKDYGQIAKRFRFYMTHGFEQDMPIGFGNFTWFNENYKNFVVLENTPSPDYQWFYDPTWSYTTQQITAYEEKIFDHLFNNIQRGVIFNQMWHDYSITSQPQYGKDRIINKSNIAMYDAVKTKFNEHDIYCPTPYELQYKLCLMAQGNYSWKSINDTINIKLDVSKVDLDSAFLFTGGMGLRINNTAKKITEVFINGKNHYAYNDQVVILPSMTKPVADIKVVLEDKPTNVPHLLFVSKQLGKIEKTNDGLALTVNTKNIAKYKFKASAEYIVLNSDSWERDKEGLNLISGNITSDRKIVLKKMRNTPITVLGCNTKISSYSENEKSCTFVLEQNNTDSQKQFVFSSVKSPSSVKFDDKIINPNKEGTIYTIDLKLLEESKSLTIYF